MSSCALLYAHTRVSTRTGALLGSGEFGVVNKGKWDTGGGEITVAVKVLKDNSFEGMCT